jgi:hypothetical protein
MSHGNLSVFSVSSRYHCNFIRGVICSTSETIEFRFTLEAVVEDLLEIGLSVLTSWGFGVCHE